MQMEYNGSYRLTTRQNLCFDIKFHLIDPFFGQSPTIWFPLEIYLVKSLQQILTVEFELLQLKLMQINSNWI